MCHVRFSKRLHYQLHQMFRPTGIGHALGWSVPIAVGEGSRKADGRVYSRYPRRNPSMSATGPSVFISEVPGSYLTPPKMRCRLASRSHTASDTDRQEQAAWAPNSLPCSRTQASTAMHSHAGKVHKHRHQQLPNYQLPPNQLQRANHCMTRILPAPTLSASSFRALISASTYGIPSSLLVRSAICSISPGK
jgi:hypothetical protein